MSSCDAVGFNILASRPVTNLLALLSLFVHVQDAAAAPEQSSSSGDAGTGIAQPHITDTHQQPQQQPEQQPAVQQAQPRAQVQRSSSSLHEQVLYEMPPAGQTLPPLPRFRPRKQEQEPVPILQALQLVQVGLITPVGAHRLLLSKAAQARTQQA
jgi:hypothetical protein